MGRGGFLQLLFDVFFPCIFLFANFLFFSLTLLSWAGGFLLLLFDSSVELVVFAILFLSFERHLYFIERSVLNT